MKKALASEVLNMIELLHSGISWVSRSKQIQEAQIGDVEITFNKSTHVLEFRLPCSWVQVTTPNENTAKRFVSTVKVGLTGATNTKDLLECLHPECDEEAGVSITLFHGL